MKTFIRLDQVGHWRGAEHQSSFQGWGNEVEYLKDIGADVYFENGISCYLLDEDGMADLYKYWISVASMDENDAKRMQVTIFNGEINGFGTDGEYVATCTETVKEFSAVLLFEKWREMKQRWFDDDDTTAADAKEYIAEHAQEMIDFINAQ